VRKSRHKLTTEEEAALAADLILREQLVTKLLMRKYNASRSLIDRVSRETKRNAFIEVKVTQHTCGTIAE
jgi:Holliday junction resolvase-like predicted endonuclease